MGTYLENGLCGNQLDALRLTIIALSKQDYLVRKFSATVDKTPVIEIDRPFAAADHSKITQQGKRAFARIEQYGCVLCWEIPTPQTPVDQKEVNQ